MVLCSGLTTQYIFYSPWLQAMAHHHRQTSGVTRFTRAFPCNKKITKEQTVKILVEQWFEHYGAPKEVHSDENVRIRSDTGWYKRVLDALNVHVTTGVPYTHTTIGMAQDALFCAQGCTWFSKGQAH